MLEVPNLVECVTVILKQAPLMIDFIDMETNSW